MITKQTDEKNNRLRLSVTAWLFVDVKNIFINAAAHIMNTTHPEILLLESSSGDVR